MTQVRRLLFRPQIADQDPIVEWKLNALYRLLSYTLLVLVPFLAGVIVLGSARIMVAVLMAVMASLVMLYHNVRHKKLSASVNLYIAVTALLPLTALAVYRIHDPGYLLAIQIVISTVYLGKRATIVWTTLFALLLAGAALVGHYPADPASGAVGMWYRVALPPLVLGVVLLCSLGARSMLTGLISTLRPRSGRYSADRVEDKLRQVMVEKNEFVRTIEKELEFARKVQQHILPQTMPEFETLDITVRYIPAMKVSGDFYDVIPLDNKHVAFLIFDAAGHGIAAALVTAIGRSAFVYYLQQSMSPGYVLTMVNEHIRASTPQGIFITAFLMVLDLETNLFRYSNAGHVPPVFYQSEKRSCTELLGGGPPLGFLNTFTYEEKTLELHQRDRLFFYTDGLAEPAASVTQGFTADGIIEEIKNGVGLTSAELMQRIWGRYEASIGDCETINDDICMLMVSARTSRFSEIVTDLLPQNERRSPLIFQRIYKENEINGLCSVVLKEMDRNGYPDPTIRQMRTVIVELVRNAIYHGNQGDTGKGVRVAYHVNNKRTILSFMDEGPGFDAQTVLQQQEENAALAGTSKGLSLVNQFADFLFFSERGNCVVLIKNRVT